MCHSCDCVHACTYFSAFNAVNIFLDTYCPGESFQSSITCISVLLWISGFIAMGVCWHLIPNAITLLIPWAVAGIPSLFIACSLLIYLCLFCMFCFLPPSSCYKLPETSTPSLTGETKDVLPQV